MYQHHLKKYPPLPKTLDEIIIEKEWSLCANKKDRFLIKDIFEYDPQNKKMMRFITYGSDLLLKVLFDGELNTSDGTFDFAADFFYQVYILMSYYGKKKSNRKMFPCVYTLLKCKTKVAYSRMLNEIRL